MSRHLIRRLRSKLRRRAIRRTSAHHRRSDLPERLRPAVLYVVGDPQQWAIFLCPCGAGHDIVLRIDDAGNWTLVRDGRRPTLAPSVNSFDAQRRCHFWLRNGRVHWCADSLPSR